MHVMLAVFFAVQVPIAIWMQFALPEVFNLGWKTYLIFLSLYAVVSTHWSASAAETPTRED